MDNHSELTGSWIKELRVSLARVPPHKPMHDAVQRMEALELVVVAIADDAGNEGLGFTYTLGKGGAAIVSVIKDCLAGYVLGVDPTRVEYANHAMHWGVHWVGRTGLTQLAISAVDNALWDLRSRQADQPLWRHLGGYSGTVPTYNTDCGWLQMTKRGVLDAVQEAVDAGFSAVKIKVGRPELRTDVDRVSAVRDLVGDDVRIMVDANHAFTPAEAVRRATALEDLAITWFEEPIRADNVQGHRRLRDATSIPIALGESLYSLHEVRNFVEAGAVDVLQADVCRIGGFTVWRKAAAVAEAWGIEVAPHHMMELHVHAAASTPAATYVEYIPALSAAVRDPLQMQEGHVTAPDRPGVGIQFRPEVLNLSAVVSI